MAGTGVNTANTDALIRSNLWSAQLKDVLYADLMARGYVNWLTDFPDGTTFNIPSVGSMTAQDYVEDQAIEYQALDTGNFTFTINQYKSAATYITNKMKQDSYLMSQLVGMFVPKMARALAEDLETNILKEGQPKTGNPAGYQTAGATNNINGYNHRRIGTTTLNSKYVLGPADFAYANLALDKCYVPRQNRIAIVDPHVEYVLDTLSNITNVSNNPRWEGVIADGLGTGMRFSKSIYGFDVYVSNFLPVCGQNQTGTSETINSIASGANAKVNLFFSAAPDVLPFVGAYRQMPQVESEYNKDYQREEHVTTSRYGLKIYRPENLLTFLSDPSAVS